MLGIWHGGDWLKRYLAQPIYGQVECGSPIPSWLLHSLIIGSFLGILSVNGLDYMCRLWMLYPHYFRFLYASYEYVS